MLAHGALFLVASIAGIAQAGNTTCKTTSLDWYTQSTGETPCRTYERLRQVCSADWLGLKHQIQTKLEASDQRPPVTIAAGSLCVMGTIHVMHEYGVGSSVNGDTGFDAGAGAYGIYLSNCGKPTNKSLPDNVQTAVCRQDIKLPSFLYNLFWVDGAWFYEYSKGTAQLDMSSGNNNTGLCPTSSSSAVPTATGTGTLSPTSQPSSSSQSNTPVGAIAGGVVGGVVLLAAAVFLGFFISRRRKDKRGVIDLTEENKSPSATFEPYNLPPGAIAQPVAITPYQAPSSSELSSSAGSPPPTQAFAPRHNKPGLIAPSPPNRAEIYQSQPLLPTDATSSSGMSDRHEDSDVLSSTFGLGRSASGRLPPAYQTRD